MNEMLTAAVTAAHINSVSLERTDAQIRHAERMAKKKAVRALRTPFVFVPRAPDMTTWKERKEARRLADKAARPTIEHRRLLASIGINFPDGIFMNRDPYSRRVNRTPGPRGIAKRRAREWANGAYNAQRAIETAFFKDSGMTWRDVEVGVQGRFARVLALPVKKGIDLNELNVATTEDAA